MSASVPLFTGSQIYDPVAVLRRGDEVIIVARIGMKNSQRFMVIEPSGRPAWPHEPLASLSDVGWTLVAHRWHDVTPEPAGDSPRPAKTLARLMVERA